MSNQPLLSGEQTGALLAALVESSDDAIVSKTLDGVILTWNAGAERIYGYSAEEAKGRQMVMLQPPGRPDEERDILSRIRAGMRVDHYETVRMRKDGRSVDVSLTISPVKAEDGTIIAASHIARDITEQKKLAEQLRHTQKLESLGVLAGGVAHDFNNLLTGILGNTSLALETLSPSNPARAPLQRVLSASERAADLTKQLLAYAGKGRFVTGPVDMSDLVREISELIQTSIPRTVQLRLDLATELPPIDADGSQIQQLVMNLVINGAEAIGEGNNGTVEVTTGLDAVDKVYAQTVLGTPEERVGGSYVTLEIRDTGCGMDESTLSRIFDPFFTTKFTGRGLGLAAAQGIVRGHKGLMRVQSEPGKGSTFKVLFPAMSRPHQVVTPKATGDLPSGDATILIIDDEQVVRQTAKEMLERCGYTVLTAENGKEGRDLFRVVGDKITLVILDMTMPVMSGEETLRNLRAVKPNVAVLLSSGYSEVDAVRRFSGKGLAGFLQKPYTAAQLAETVRDAINGRHSDWA